jgi:hypothetical protein
MLASFAPYQQPVAMNLLFLPGGNIRRIALAPLTMMTSWDYSSWRRP